MKWMLAIFLLAAAGCSSSPPAPRGFVSLGAQLQKQDADLVGQHFRTLLDFESASDAVFVRSAPSGAASGHTGSASLRTGPDATVRISSLLFGLTLPADWTLLGGYVRPAAAGRVTATLIADGQAIARTARGVPAGAWAFIGVDLTGDACRAALARAKSIELTVNGPGGFDLDDVMLVNNRHTLTEVPGVWSVTQSGFEVSVNVLGRPPRTFALAASGHDGVNLEEVDPIRVRLHDSAGQAITLLADGRMIVNGRLAADAPAEAVAAQQDPGSVTLIDSDGQLERETPGDADNDGYNEQRGAYQITAAAARLRIRLAPGRVMLQSPVFEIRGLPREADTVTVDGKLIDRTVRLADGTLLVMLPMRVESPVEVTVGVSGR